MKTIDVVCIGASVLDISSFPIEKEGFFEREPNIVQSISFRPGGDAANQSVVLTRLGHKVTFITKLGTDEGGDILYQQLVNSGVDMHSVVREPGKASAVNNILIGEKDTRVYITNLMPDAPSRFAVFREEDIDFSVLKQAKVVSIGSFFVHPVPEGKVMMQILKTVKEAGGITCADVKADDRECRIERFREALPYLDYMFANEKEAKNLTGLNRVEEMADYFLHLGIKTMIIKLGGKGCYVKSAGGEGFYETPFYVNPVDTTGAGDNFMAGFISGLVQEQPLFDCIQFAKATSAICVGSIGASSGVKSMEQVRQFILERRDNKCTVL